MDSIPQDDVPQKQCSKCKEIRPLEHFRKDGTKRDGHEYTCKFCKNPAYGKQEVLPDGMKRCSRCEQIKPATEDYFGLSKRASDGFREQCKACRHLIEHPDTIPRGVLLSNKDIPKGQKRCFRCRQVKPATLEYFDRNKSKKDGLHSECKDCRYSPRLPKGSEVVRDGFRLCSKCKQWKPATLEYFHRNKTSADGLFHRCKVCHNDPPKVNDIPDGYKRCSTCKATFPATLEFFYHHKAHEDGLDSRCQTCARKKAKEYANLYKEKNSTEIDINHLSEKQCRTCGGTFRATKEFFHTDRRVRDGLTYDCKTCISKRLKEYYRRPEVRETKIAYEKVHQALPEVRKRKRVLSRKYYHHDLEKSRLRGRRYAKASNARRKATRSTHVPGQRRLVLRGILPQMPIQDKPHYIYVLKYPESMGGYVFYIGKGMGDRILKHEIEAQKGNRSHKCNVIRKIWRHGEQIVKEILASFETHEEALQYEIALIFFMRGYKHLTNLTDGGEGVVGIKLSAEARRKIGERQKGKLGKPHLEETKQRLREANTGKVRTEEVKRRQSERLKNDPLLAERMRRLTETRIRKQRKRSTIHEIDEARRDELTRDVHTLHLEVYSQGLLFQQANEDTHP